MPFLIIRDDITRLQCDAIVNPTNPSLISDGGLDKKIHDKAGKELQKELQAFKSSYIGECFITKGYQLPCSYIIHTLGPIYKDGLHNEHQLLANCYYNSLTLALKHNIKTIAFPLISSGTYKFPKEEALQIAINCITQFLFQHDMTIYLVVYDKNSFQISQKLFDHIQSYIDDNYEEEHYEYNLRASICYESYIDESPISLEDFLKQKDESFSEMLFRIIDEKGISDSECYKKANIDRKLFSKIRSIPHYKPSKNTVIALALALQLDLEKTKELLSKAGYALSHSYKFDVIIEYFIIHQNYNIFEINEALFYYDQSLLGNTKY